MAAQPAGAVASARTAEPVAPAPTGPAAVRSPAVAEVPDVAGVPDLPDEAYSEYAPPIVASERNGALRAELIERLRQHFSADPDIYIWGDLGIYYRRNDPRRFVAPDVFVVRGVPARPPRRVYKTWK